MASSNQTIRVNDITNSPLPDLISSPQTCVKNLYVSTGSSAPGVINTTPTAYVATAVTNAVTSAQIKSGFIAISGTPGGAFAINLPLASALVASFSSPKIGDSFTLLIQNNVAVHTGTVSVAVGGDANTTIMGTPAIATAQGAHVTFVITAVTVPAVFVLVSQ